MSDDDDNDCLLYEETDAVVAPNAEDTWVEVKGFWVHIVKTIEGIAVSIYNRDEEDWDSLGSCAAADWDLNRIERLTSTRKVSDE